MRDIVGYEGEYAITEDGQVWSYKRKRFLKQWDAGQGYLYVCLSQNGQVKKFRVHRLVAEAYIPNPEEKPEVDHINKNRKDNSKDNLRWVSSAENKKTADFAGKSKIFSKVRCIETGKVYNSCVDAAEAVNTHRYNINNVLNGKQKTAGGYHWERVED